MGGVSAFVGVPAVVVLAVAKIPTVANVPAVAVVLALVVVVLSSDKAFRLWDYDYWTDNFVSYWTKSD
jgi:hypothetical protein